MATMSNPIDPLATMTSLDALRHVAELVKYTQPTWSGHLTTVCDELEAARAKLAEKDAE